VKRRGCVVAVAATVAAPWPVATRGQRARRVGVLYSSVDPGKPPPGSEAAWRKVESILGETVRVERRYAARRLERLPELADDLLRRGDAEVLWPFGHTAAVAAVRATRTVPIVFSFAFMPVECGLVSSLAKPRGNVTGFAIADGPEEPLKVFDFVKAVAPSARRWGSLTGDPNLATTSGSPLDLRPRADAAARSQGFERTVYAAPRLEDVDAALTKAAAAHLDGITVFGGDSGYEDVADRVAEFALRQRWITAALFSPGLFSAGLLIYHGATWDEFVRLNVRNLDIVTRILKGAKPADFPVELPSRYELAINLTTAQKLGIVLPQSLLLQADRVVQ